MYEIYIYTSIEMSITLRVLIHCRLELLDLFLLLFYISARVAAVAVVIKKDDIDIYRNRKQIIEKEMNIMF